MALIFSEGLIRPILQSEIKIFGVRKSRKFLILMSHKIIFLASYGWRFKLKPGAREFIFILSRAECELVLYTRLDYFSMLVGMAEKLAAKFGGLLLLGENCQGMTQNFVKQKANISSKIISSQFKTIAPRA